MAYTVKLGNITEIECDVIVNSLGINGSVYGRLCESIIEAANSPDIKNYIDSKTNNPVGVIYDTEAGDLPCKKLFHVVFVGLNHFLYHLTAHGTCFFGS